MKQHARLERKVEWCLGIWYGGGTKETRATTKGKKEERGVISLGAKMARRLLSLAYVIDEGPKLGLCTKQ